MLAYYVFYSTGNIDSPPRRLNMGKDKGGFKKSYLIFFLIKPYSVTIHSNRLHETIRMHGHTKWYSKKEVTTQHIILIMHY